MRHLHSQSHLRLSIAGLQDSDRYVDTLLKLAREQILASHAPARRRSPPLRHAAAVNSLTMLH